MAAVADDPGAAAARGRVAALLERLARIELQVVVVAPPDATRLAARDRADEAAMAAGRGSLLDEATAAAREVTLRAFSRAGFSGTWAATDMAVSVATAGDRVAAAAAFEEAAMAAVVEDLVDADTLEVLRSTADELGDLTGLPSPGSLSAFAMPAADAIRGPIQVAIVAAFVLVGAVIGMGLGGALGLGVIALGLVVVAAFAQRASRREP
jgi:hypothetical protein